MCSFDMSARLENISTATKITVCVLRRATTLTRGERKSELQCQAQASRCIMICIIFLLKITLRKCFSSSVQHSLNILKYYRQKIISFVPSKLLIYCNLILWSFDMCARLLFIILRGKYHGVCECAHAAMSHASSPASEAPTAGGRKSDPSEMSLARYMIKLKNDVKIKEPKSVISPFKIDRSASPGQHAPTHKPPTCQIWFIDPLWAPTLLDAFEFFILTMLECHS
jgi:hypothetical protein